MENENFTFDVTGQKLLPTHVFERCTDCENTREYKRRNICATIIKVVTVLTVLSGCFTAVACAIYCNSALKDIRHLHADIMKVTNGNDDQTSHVPGNAREAIGTIAGKHRSLKQLASTGNSNAEKKGQNYDWFLEDIAEGSDAFEEYDEDSEYSKENESANDIAYNDDDYGDTDDEYDDDYFDETDDEYYGESYALGDVANDDRDDNGDVDGHIADTDDYLDLDDDIEGSSGELPDDEDLNRVRRDTGSQKEKKEKNRKGKGKGGKGKGKKGSKGDKNQNKKGRKQKKLKSLPAAQFNADMTLEKLIKIDAGYNMYENTGDCKYSSQMGGTYCRHNKTLTPDERKPLGIFKKEEWVAYNKSPVTMKDKKFLVKNNGTHLVIGQLFMEGSQYPVSASIVRERVGVDPQYLTCMNNCINYTCTCSMFGLMNLKSGDVLYMQTNNGINKIFFEEAATYIGVVQLNRD